MNEVGRLGVPVSGRRLAIVQQVLWADCLLENFGSMSAQGCEGRSDRESAV